ncbi:MAG TPA: hybrid sensor histidine kinase/response regulator [Opitutaceae bacterium]|nr:hybrid sensor histidine kinase/response regulator [Opitutaceae bacterium]
MSAVIDKPRSAAALPRVMIVEDDRVNARILAGILKPEGYELLAVGSGEAALQSYAEFRPDLVLLDVMMPGINGYEACRRLKQAHGEQCAPIVFITAKNESDDVVEGLAAGGVDYLPKPFRPKEAVARIRVHLQNRLLSEQQRRLVEQLNQSNAAKNRLMGMVAHDLRNPLASIRGLADFLRDGSVGAITAEQRDLVDNIFSASQSMLDLINELLDAAVVEAGELRVEIQPAPLAELLDKAVALNNINAARKGTRIAADLAGCPPSVPMDPKKIRQVVDNLLSNAVKFSPPDSTVRLRVDAEPGRCTVAVRDQGPGVPEDERGKLFQDFGRTSVRPTAGEQSIGLGLAICRKIVEAHGGSIAAENQPGGGCIFKFSLPLP